MRHIVDLSRSHMAGFHANRGDFDLEDAKLLQTTEHVSVLLMNMGNRVTSTVLHTERARAPDRMCMLIGRHYVQN